MKSIRIAGKEDYDSDRGQVRKKMTDNLVAIMWEDGEREREGKKERWGQIITQRPEELLNYPPVTQLVDPCVCVCMWDLELVMNGPGWWQQGKVAPLYCTWKQLVVSKYGIYWTVYELPPSLYVRLYFSRRHVCTLLIHIYLLACCPASLSPFPLFLQLLFSRPKAISFQSLQSNKLLILYIYCTLNFCPFIFLLACPCSCLTPH